MELLFYQWSSTQGFSLVNCTAYRILSKLYLVQLLFFFFLINIAHHDLKNRFSAVESNQPLSRISAFFNVKTSP